MVLHKFLLIFTKRHTWLKIGDKDWTNFRNRSGFGEIVNWNIKQDLNFRLAVGIYFS